MLTISPVASKADLKAFIAAPRLLYADMAGYFPPLDMDREIMFDPAKSAFFAAGKAQYFLARRGDQVVGRISAQVDSLATGPFHDGVGFFGCLDAADDQEAVIGLFRAAENWLRSEGKSVARGPFSLSINSECGLLVAGQDVAPMVMMPWHPPYLAAHVEAAGYQLAKRVHSYQLDLGNLDYDRDIRGRGLDRVRSDLVVRDLNTSKFAQDTEIGRVLFNDAWSNNWGFVPLSPPEIKALGDNFRLFLKKDCAVIVEKDGKPAGFALALPNVAEVTRETGPRPSPLGWIKLAWRLLTDRYESARIVMFGVSGQYRSAAMGAMIAAAIMERFTRNGKKRGLKTIEAGWVLEDNAALNRILEVFGFRRVRTHALYERRFDA